MQIKIIAVGKIKESYLRDGLQEYLKRLGAYAKVQILEVADEKTPDRASQAEEEQIRLKESTKMARYIEPGDFLIALDIQGKMFDSEGLAGFMEGLAIAGKSSLAFLIGGSLGLHKSILDQAQQRLSFSKMTFPHQLMRLILLEQVYRGFKIIKGEPYHK